jgi:hypothetical protein
MDITAAMLRAARAAEFDHYGRNRGSHDRFRPMSDGLMRAVIDAAISAIGEDDEPDPEPPEVEEPEQEAPPRPAQPTRIVRTRKPTPRR